MTASSTSTAATDRRAPTGRQPRRWRPAPLSLYAGGVGVLGVAVTAAVLVQQSFLGDLAAHPLPLGVLAAALILGELRAIPIPRGDNTSDDITISTIFAVALVVVGPLSFALVAMAVAVGIDDLRSRRSGIQLLFNCGQYALSIALARATYCALSGAPLLGGHTPFQGEDLFAALAAGVVFVLVNDVLVAGVLALATDQPLRGVVLADPRFKLQNAALLIGLAPVSAVLLKESVLMLPLLILPILTVGRAAHLAVLRERQSLHDPLTGLANRLLFRLSVERALRSGDGPGAAVLMLDLDHFKDVNDTLGHHIGDELLCTVAARISQEASDCGAEATVARLGGDEFAVLLVGDRPRERAEQFADRLLQGLSLPVEVHGSRLAVQASIGITSTDTGRPQDVHGALKQADIALYEAKQGRARATVFDAATMTTSTDRVHLLPQLQDAIDRRQLAVLYQPQVDARTGRVLSVEALVRWDHPTQGRLGPGSFIDLAESAGLIAPITTFVMEEALAAVARWERLGSPIGVSVNVSARQLSDLSLPDQVAGLLLRTGVAASRLTIEVTESSLMADPRAARVILRALRDMGVKLAIDDFGTGYSSLVLLQQLDVDELKVDRSFVMGMASAGNDVLVRSIVDLGHSIGLTVVAEGVETEDVAGHLRALGCDLLQGYLFGRPMEPAAVDALITGATPVQGTTRLATDSAVA